MPWYLLHPSSSVGLQVNLEEAIELQHFAFCLGVGIGQEKMPILTIVFQNSIRHLGGDGSLPNQFVEALLIAVGGYQSAVDIGGANLPVSL